MAAKLTSKTTGASARTTSGLQPAQYRDQLAQAGLLDAAKGTTGTRRRELAQALSWLIHHLRLGRIDSQAKEHAAALGLLLTTTE